MTDNNVSELIKHYQKSQKIRSILLGILLVIAIIFVPKIIFKIIACAVIFLIGLAAELITDRKKQSILTNQMDPFAFYAVSHTKTDIIAVDTDVQIAYFTGDYKTAIELVENEKRIRAAKGKKYNNVISCFFLCLSYFEAGDYEKAKESIAYFKSLFDGKKLNESFVTIYFKPLEYIENFIDKNYEECIKIKDIKEQLPPKMMSNTFKARMDYYTALAYYYNSDYDSAKQLFLHLTAFCPKLNYARLSQYYLDAMNNGEEYAEIKIQQNEQIHLPVHESNRKVSKKSIIALIILVICIGWSV